MSTPVSRDILDGLKEFGDAVQSGNVSGKLTCRKVKLNQCWLTVVAVGTNEIINLLRNALSRINVGWWSLPSAPSSTTVHSVP